VEKLGELNLIENMGYMLNEFREMPDNRGVSVVGKI